MVQESTCAPTCGADGRAVPRVHCFSAPTTAASSRASGALRGAREQGRGALHVGLRAPRLHGGGPHREEAPVPLPSGQPEPVCGDRGLQLHLRVLPELRYQPDAPRPRSDSGQPSVAAAGGRRGLELWLRQHLVYLHRADHLLRVRARLRAAGLGRRVSRTCSSPTAT